MPQSTVPAAVTGLPASTEAHGRIPAGGHATIIPADRREFLRQLAVLSLAATVVTAAATVVTAAAESQRLIQSFSQSPSIGA